MCSLLHNRDLVGELQAEQDAAEQAELEAAAVAVAVAAAAPPTPPPAVHHVGAIPAAKRIKLSPPETFAEAVVESDKWDFAGEGVAVTVEEQGVRWWKDNLEPEVLATASMIPGAYWAVGIGNGKLVYKNPQTGLLLFFACSSNEPGWYIGTEYTSSAKDLMKVGQQEPHKVLAWLGNDVVPGNPHVPFWHKKPTPTATSQPAIHYYQSRMHGSSNP